MSKKNINIKLNDRIKNYFIDQWGYYNMINTEQFIDYFLIDNYDYTFVSDYNISDISIWNEQLEDNSDLVYNKINMIISVENLNKWSWFLHYNKYNNYGDDKINIYLYNHISKIVQTDNYIAIPLIHFYINYYIKKENLFHYVLNKTNFESKKFCLCINKSNMNQEISQYINILQTIDNVDNINIYSDIIKNKSCYHSTELLNIFNKYKFIFVAENSINDGYITEKIFNCLFAQCIPIYLGSHKIDYFFNKDCFINGNLLINHMNNNNTINLEIIKQKLLDLNKNEDEFNDIITKNKINLTYDDENYKDKLKIFIDKYIK
jgi:hypothetical protein